MSKYEGKRLDKNAKYRVIEVQDDEKAEELSEKGLASLAKIGIATAAALIIGGTIWFVAMEANTPVSVTATPIPTATPMPTATPSIQNEIVITEPGFSDVNDTAQVESVVREAMDSLGDFASQAHITDEDMRNIVYALNAAYVANPDLLPKDLRTDVNEKLFALYNVYLGSNDTRLFGISDGKKNGPHNFELSKLFVAGTPNVELIEEFDQGLNQILDADEVTSDVTATASKLYARLACQSKVVLTDEPVVDDTEEASYGVAYAYALANNVIFPIYEPCQAAFSVNDMWYSSKSGEDIVYSAAADQLNKTGRNLQSYITGNCPKFQ